MLFNWPTVLGDGKTPIGSMAIAKTDGNLTPEGPQIAGRVGKRNDQKCDTTLVGFAPIL